MPVSKPGLDGVRSGIGDDCEKDFDLSGQVSNRDFPEALMQLHKSIFLMLLGTT